jgi:multiple sugar transport system permease protein
MLPTLLSVTLVVLLPLLAIFWISAKPVELADLRPPAPVVREDLRDADEAVATLRYRLRNSSQEEVIENVVLTDTDPRWRDASRPCPRGARSTVLRLRCALGTLEGGGRITLEIPAVLSGDLEALEAAIEDGTPALVTGEADNILTNLEFTWENFREVFDAREFWTVIWATLFYTIFGTCGALLVGLFAAMLLNKSFRGQGVLRGSTSSPTWRRSSRWRFPG